MKNKFYISTNFKLLLFLTIFFKIGFVCAAFESLNHKSRISEVMYQGPGGIEEVNKKTLFAEIKNLSFDLNLAEISSRFGCKTLMGQTFIAYTLAKLVSPHDKNSTIKNRQDLIQFLMNHPDLQEKIGNLLQEAIEHEAVVMKFMQKRFVTDPNGHPIELGLEAMEKYTVPVVLTQYGRFEAVWNTPAYLWDKFQGIRVIAGDLPTAQQALLVPLGFIGLGHLVAPKELNWASKEVFSSVWGALTASYYLYKHYAGALAIRDSLYALNRLIDISRQIEDICNQHGVDHQFKLSSIRSEKGVSLLNDLNIDRYKTKEGLMSYVLATPLIHTFIYDVYEKDINLAPMYASIAEMDAYVAIAKKMTDLQNTDHKFSFVEFLDVQKPEIRAKEFWNMLVSVGDVVTNDISEDRNIILTGSNEGGKTTAIRAILQNIVLAQTFGIAAASDFKLTQFDVINSYLNVSDDILSGKSRFASELKQAQDILHRIKALKPTEKFFFAFDELFTGTNGEDGAECAYRFIDNVASFEGIQFIYATHFNKLKTIGSNNPACVNYKIEPPLRNAQGEFIRNDKGQLIYPYKLSPGANDVNVAMDRAKDAGIFA
jgi:hypothetical protein